MKIAGIDEAGKGPVIGPMCIAGIVADEAGINSLKNLGVKDSKKIAPKKREYLAGQIKKYIDDFYIFEISAQQIDELRKIMTMNAIAVTGFSRVLENLHPDKVYLDAADVNADRFGKQVRDTYSKKYPETAKQLTVVSEHKADDTYPVVAAASILAKVRRDEIVSEMRKEIGIDFGSGYPSDPKTKQFLLDWAKEHGSLPDIVRHSWKTAENVLNSL
ncbi:MAG: ribonuclease HII [Methanosarcinaceae archaeon]|nr:ribonuclease HII [Methanosarcinaceae archaeon]